VTFLVTFTITLHFSFYIPYVKHFDFHKNLFNLRTNKRISSAFLNRVIQFCILQFCTSMSCWYQRRDLPLFCHWNFPLAGVTVCLFYEVQSLARRITSNALMKQSEDMRRFNYSGSSRSQGKITSSWITGGSIRPSHSDFYDTRNYVATRVG